MTQISEEEFLFNYQLNHFNENPKEPFKKAILKKRCLNLSLAYSSKSFDNATACNILEDQLKSHFLTVDERSGINNYAKATLDLISNVKNVSKSWRSGVTLEDNPLFNLNTQIKGCSNPSKDESCGNSLPPPSMITTLLGNGVSKNFGTASGRQWSSDNNNMQRAEIKPSFDCKQPSKSLYSSYRDGDNISLAPEHSANRINLKENKSSLYSTYGSNSNSKREEIDFETQKGFKKQSNFKGKFRKYENEETGDSSCIEPKRGIYTKLTGGKSYYKKNKPLVQGIMRSGNSNEENSEFEKQNFQNHFKTAGQELQLNEKKSKMRGRAIQEEERGFGGYQGQGTVRKFLGGKRTVSSKFVPPVRNSDEYEYSSRRDEDEGTENEVDERLKNIDPKMVELIKNEIMDTGSKISWDDIAGLHFAKSTIQEIVVWPMLRPDIFTGLRRPPKGILLFGPPGTGKTLIGKCIASQSKSTFFSISASSLTSKWIGDGEKMVRALFAVARCEQPAVVFIDEIDSLLSQRNETEHESSRRIKTEFLVQLDGAGTGDEERILIIGATNRPQELDEAARRRLVKRLYIPLPDKEARKQLVENLMKLERNTLSKEELEEVSKLTDGYSGADMKNLCSEASLGPIRSISSKDMFQISADEVRPVSMEDFKQALLRVKSSVSPKDLEIYLNWDQQYGSGGVS